MVHRADNDLFEDEGGIDLRPLLRFAGWGMAAVAAVALAVVAGRTEIAGRRAAAALASIGAAPGEPPRSTAVELAARAERAEREARRLSELVAALSAERERTSARLSALELNFKDLTGSIAETRAASAGVRENAREKENVPADTASGPGGEPKGEAVSERKSEPGEQPGVTAVVRIEPGRAPSALAPAPMPSRSGELAVLSSPPAVAGAVRGSAVSPTGPAEEIPLPRPNPLSTSQTGVQTAARQSAADQNRPRVGVELGAAASMEGLRALWSRIKEGQPQVIGDLKPIVTVRELRSGAVELHLVAGPLASTSAAGRICAVLAPQGIACRTTAFEGQRLALQ